MHACVCVTSCACLLYLVYQLQDSGLPGEEPLLHIHFVSCLSLPGGPHVYLRWMLYILRYWKQQILRSSLFFGLSSVQSNVATVFAFRLTITFVKIILLMCGFELYAFVTWTWIDSWAHRPDCLMWGVWTIGIVIFRNLRKWKFILIIHDIKQGWGPKQAHLQLNVGGCEDTGLFSMCLCCRGGGGMEEERVPVGHSWCATVSTFYLLLSQLTGWGPTNSLSLTEVEALASTYAANLSLCLSIWGKLTDFGIVCCYCLSCQHTH